MCSSYDEPLELGGYKPKQLSPLLGKRLQLATDVVLFRHGNVEASEPGVSKKEKCWAFSAKANINEQFCTVSPGMIT